MAERMRGVELPSSLCEAVEQKFGTHFGSLEQFLNFVLRELVRDVAAQMDQSEKLAIQKRLKDLGYI